MRRRRGSAESTMACSRTGCDGALLEAMINTDRVCDVCGESGTTVLSCRKCDYFDVCQKCADGRDTEQDDEGEASQSASAAGEEGDEEPDKEEAGEAASQTQEQQSEQGGENVDPLPGEEQQTEVDGEEGAADKPDEEDKPDEGERKPPGEGGEQPREDEGAKETGDTGEPEQERQEDEEGKKQPDEDGSSLERVPPPRPGRRMHKYRHMEKVLGVDRETLASRCDTLPKVCPACACARARGATICCVCLLLCGWQGSKMALFGVFVPFKGHAPDAHVGYCLQCHFETWPVALSCGDIISVLVGSRESKTWTDFHFIATYRVSPRPQTAWSILVRDEHGHMQTAKATVEGEGEEGEG